jgi:hypothetical protein
VCAYIAKLPHSEFTVNDVCTAFPDIPRNVIHMTLRHKAKVGWLERVDRQRYRIGGVRIKTRTSSGIVADAMWLVLRTAPFDKPLRAPEIIGETESLIGRGTSYRGIHTNLLKWTLSGDLERSGERGEYAYRVATERTERPSLSRFL